MASLTHDVDFEWLIRGCRETAGGKLCRRLYGPRKLRAALMRGTEIFEKGAFRSASMRRILWERHGVKVGAYSYGPCLVPGVFPSGVTIGRYVSIAGHVKAVLRNHPMDRLSTHPFFFNSYLGFVEHDQTIVGSLVIDHDAWIGESALIAPSCRRIGLGAIVAAGSVVTRDVPDFTIVGGIPAKPIRMRLGDAEQQAVRESRWWERTIEELVSDRAWFEGPAQAAIEAGALRGMGREA